MSTEENKALVRRWTEEGWNQKKALEIADEIFSPDCIAYDPTMGKLSFERILKVLPGYFTAFPDVHCKIEEQIAEGNKVVTRWTITATHEGEFEGIAPTGKKWSMAAMAIWRIEEGKCVEVNQIGDDLGMMKQLGAIPSEA